MLSYTWPAAALLPYRANRQIQPGTLFITTITVILASTTASSLSICDKCAVSAIPGVWSHAMCHLHKPTNASLGRHPTKSSPACCRAVTGTNRSAVVRKHMVECQRRVPSFSKYLAFSSSRFPHFSDAVWTSIHGAIYHTLSPVSVSSIWLKLEILAQ